MRYFFIAEDFNILEQHLIQLTKKKYIKQFADILLNNMKHFVFYYQQEQFAE